MLGLKTTSRIEAGSFLAWLITAEYVVFSAFLPVVTSVCEASQTSAAMTISGKSALRKKRLTGFLVRRVAAESWAAVTPIRGWT